MADVWANYMACHSRVTCHIACKVLPTGEFNGVSSQSHVSHCRVLPLGEFTAMIPEPHATLQDAVTWRNQCHDRVTLQGVIIPSAILKIVFRQILFIFVFNAVWALTSGGFCIVSDTLVLHMLVGAKTTDIFLSELGNDNLDCKDQHTACRTLYRAMQVVDGRRAVIYVDTAARSTSGWLCREETVQVHGSITIKPRPPTTPETARLGCGAHGIARRVLLFNVTGTGGRSAASLTLDSLTVEGVLMMVRNGHVAVVESTLLDVSLISRDTDHVGLDVINSTWTCRYPNNLTSCEVGVSADDEWKPNYTASHKNVDKFY